MSTPEAPATGWKRNGEIWERAESLPLADRGFRYGMSFFESVAVLDGKPLFLAAHIDRLRRAAKDFGTVLEIPEFDFSKLGSGMLRFYCTAGPGSPSEKFQGETFALFEAMEVGCNFPPARVQTSAAPYLPAPGGWKTGNYWQNTAAFSQARACGLDEALLFNPAGQLVSASMANVFLRIDGRWITPHPLTGSRSGVVREWVLRRMEVAENFVMSEDAARCDAAFLTNSRTGIRTVCELDGRPLVCAAATLRQEYMDEIRSA